MRQSLAVCSLAALIPLTIAACERVKTVPVARANADATPSVYVGEFRALHSAIPPGPGANIEEYH